jgi:hypothetical protein
MTIEIPTPSADLISQIETATIETNQAEAAAIAAIREKFTPYAKHNGTIMTSYEQTCYASSNGEGTTERAYYQVAGRKVRGLLCWDGFDTECPNNQNSGTYTGERLWLTEAGQWLEVSRTGEWSQWQGSSRSWKGTVRVLCDAAVVTEYPDRLDDILEELGKSMAEMCSKLPARYSKLQARAELAQRVIAAAGVK